MLPGVSSSTSSSGAVQDRVSSNRSRFAVRRADKANDTLQARLRMHEDTSIGEQSDQLQVAAQSCAWEYMTSTLQDELRRSRGAALAALETRKNDLAAEEADIAESRIRYEAERLIDFYDELSDKKVCNAPCLGESIQHITSKITEELANLIASFKSLESRVADSTKAALRLTSLPLNDTTHVSQYNHVLNSLGEYPRLFDTSLPRLISGPVDVLEDECQKIKTQIESLMCKLPSSKGRLSELLNSFSHILEGHERSVVGARSVVECCKDNYYCSINAGTLTLA